MDRRKFSFAGLLGSVAALCGLPRQAKTATAASRSKWVGRYHPARLVIDVAAGDTASIRWGDGVDPLGSTPGSVGFLARRLEAEYGQVIYYRDQYVTASPSWGLGRIYLTAFSPEQLQASLTRINRDTKVRDMTIDFQSSSGQAGAIKFSDFAVLPRNPTMGSRDYFEFTFKGLEHSNVSKPVAAA